MGTAAISKRCSVGLPHVAESTAPDLPYRPLDDIRLEPIDRSSDDGLYSWHPDAFSELAEELIRQFLGGAGDQARADLGDLAADLGVDVVGQHRIATLLGELHNGGT
jgi:hypothetical protein